jgi:hypothetical protein
MRGRVGNLVLCFGAIAAVLVAMAETFLATILVGVCLVIVAGGAAWDLIVLAGLAVDSVRLKRGQRPICVGVEYGTGEDEWFETSPGPEPYRSCDERCLLARGNPAAAARQVGSALATRLGVVTGVAMIAAMLHHMAHSGCHYPPVGAARSACSTIRQATILWMAVNPGRGCPNVDELKVDLDAAFGSRDPWGGGYEIRCFDDEIICVSPGRDRKRGTEDDIVVPAREDDASAPGYAPVR